MRRRHLVVFALVTALAATSSGTGLAANEMCPGDCNGDWSVSIDELIRGVSMALGRMDSDGCPAFDASGDHRVAVGELVAAVRNTLVGCPRWNPCPECPPDREAFIIANSLPEGAFATISLDPPRIVDPVSPAHELHNDAVARVFGDRVYIVNRFLGDSIQVLDPSDGFTTRWQCSTGAGSNPQDIVVLGDKAYVTLYAKAQLLIINPSPAPDCSDFVLGSVDLSAFADDDGIPEMDQMALVNGLLYVSLQRLLNFAPARQGAVAVIDTATDQVIGGITLTGQNPFAKTKGLSVAPGDYLVVAQVGNFGITDGGIERVDLFTGRALGFFVTEAALGGDINDFVLVSDRLGYAVVGAPDFTTSLVSFDPSAGRVTRTLLSGVEYVADIELNNRGELFVLDRTFERPGVRIFRAADGTELTPEPLDVGLPPFEVVFLR